MDSLGVLHFYYSRQLPARAVSIAQVQSRASGPGDLVDINNIELTTDRKPGRLTVTRYPGGMVFNAVDLNLPVQIYGSSAYTVENQFFEITVTADAEGQPLFYKHPFELSGVENISLTDLDGNAVTGYELRENALYHSMGGAPYWVQYYADGVVRTELLRYQPAMTRTSTPTAASYSFSPGGLLTLFSEDAYWIRFPKKNGYQLLPPYNVPANDPWYPRVRFGLRPVTREWAQQPFSPTEPYMLATWVPGKILSARLIEFERQPAYFDGRNFPDVLVYDKDYNLKYALDGTEPNSRVDKGYLFPWMRSQFIGIDEAHARCHVNVDLAEDDIAFGFYNYSEMDVVFRNLDINPFTRPLLKDKVIEFYFADRANDIPPRS